MVCIYRKYLIEYGRRIGENPFPLPISEVEACDINTEKDFCLADAIFSTDERQENCGESFIYISSFFILPIFVYYDRFAKRH